MVGPPDELKSDLWPLDSVLVFVSIERSSFIEKPLTWSKVTVLTQGEPVESYLSIGE